LIGYNTTRADFGTKPILQPSASSITLISWTNAWVLVDNIECQAGGQTGCNAMSGSSQNGIVRRCKLNGTAAGIQSSAGNSPWYCYDTEFVNLGSNAVATGMGNGHVFRCYFHGTGSAFNLNGGMTLVDCLFTGVATSSGVAVGQGGNGGIVRNCTFDACGNVLTLGTSGTSGNWWVENCLFTNTIAGKTVITGDFKTSKSIQIKNCAYYNNASDGNTLYCETNKISLTSSPYNTGDYTLNNNAGAGASCRAAGVGCGFTGSSYPDIGAFQTPILKTKKVRHRIGVRAN